MIKAAQNVEKSGCRRVSNFRIFQKGKNAKNYKISSIAELQFNIFGHICARYLIFEWLNII